ncbi:hypothetical protein RhiJN_05703 [Ceratobasidium sp. AG-Ba]|nr:hypothetical protein RhiJN_05703 [Ceratobasidium sp. AG-Ba]QRW06634.1 hypothetical protein RhiLY_05633 [Ceratobasidium sp. AG-Ba]
MLHQSLSVWLTDQNGLKLEEYGPRIVDDAAECWIPSDEGSRFRIKWTPSGDTQHKLGLRCDVRLDGTDITSRVLSAKNIAAGLPGEKDGMSVAPGVKRPLVFGCRPLMDQDELASPHPPVSEELATIRVKLTWVRCTQTKRLHKYYELKLRGFPKRDTKKEHTITAMLGDPIPSVRISPMRAIKTHDLSSPVVFVFRYGPRDWLKAQGIIPNELVFEGADPTPNELQSSCDEKKAEQKREPNSPLTIKSLHPSEKSSLADPSDVIDIDDLESDSDSDIVILGEPTKKAVNLVL